MSQGYYLVTVETELFGTWTSTHDPDDPTPDPPDPTYPILIDPLTVGWTVGNSGLVYPEPDPMKATVRLFVRDIALLDGLDVGERLVITAWGYTDAEWPVDQVPLVRTRVRVANVNASPITLTYLDEFGDPVEVAGMLVTIQCVDRRVDLAEAKVGASDWAAQTQQERSDQITDEAGLPSIDWGGPGYGDRDLGARSGGLSDALTQLTRLTNQTAGGTLDNLARPFLEPNYIDPTDDDPDPAAPWALQWLETRMSSGSETLAYLPAVLGEIDPDTGEPSPGSGLYGVVIAPETLP